MRQRLLFFDLESAPLKAWVWRAHDNYIAPERLEHDTFLLTWAAKWSDRKGIKYGRLTGEEAIAQDDHRITQELADLMRSADRVVAHNGDKFDIPLLQGRLLANGQEPLGPIPSIDTLKLARSSIKIASNKLDYLAQFLGIGQKSPMQFSDWEAAYHGDEAALRKMDRYCRQDVRLLEQVYDRLEPYMKGLPRLVEPGTGDRGVCPFCGADELERRGKYRTNASTFQRFRCRSCLRWSRARQADKGKLDHHPLR